MLLYIPWGIFFPAGSLQTYGKYMLNRNRNRNCHLHNRNYYQYETETETETATCITNLFYVATSVFSFP